MRFLFSLNRMAFVRSFRLLAGLAILSLFVGMSGASFAQSVAVQPASSLAYYPTYEFSAEVKARSQSDMSALIASELVELPVTVDQIVAKGEVLARFDCRDLQDQLALTRSSKQELLANLRLAQLQFTRLTDLQNRDLASNAAKDEALARKQSLEAQLASVELQAQLSERAVSRCELKAPFHAVVTHKFVGEGQWVNPGTPIVQLLQLDQAEIEVKIPFSFVDAKSIKTALWQPGSQPLTFLRQAKRLEPQSKMQSVWYQAPNTLVIGQQGTVQMTASDQFLPAEVLVQRQGLVGVFVLEKNTVRFQPVKGATMGRPAKLPAGWESLQIVIEGQLALQDGDVIDSR